MDKSRLEPTIFFIEKISFSLKLFSGHFYGQSFIKTVRGPLDTNEGQRDGNRWVRIKASSGGDKTYDTYLLNSFF